MASKRGLGRGLDTMIPERIHKKAEAREGNVSRETLIDINNIEPNAKQPRKKFDEEALSELAESIKNYGVIQPIILQKEISIMR